jgi:hypothetical protein
VCWWFAGGLLVETADGATRQGREGDATLTRTCLQATRLERTQEPTAGQEQEQAANERTWASPSPPDSPSGHTSPPPVHCRNHLAAHLLFQEKSTHACLVFNTSSTPPRSPPPPVVSVRRHLQRTASHHTPPSSSSTLLVLCSPEFAPGSPAPVTSITSLGLVATQARAVNHNAHRRPVPPPGPSVSVRRPRRPTDPISLASGLLLALRFAPCRGLWSCRVARDSHSHSLHHILAPSIPPGKPSFILFHSTRFLLHFFAASLVPF